jgi:hypothetical protein
MHGLALGPKDALLFVLSAELEASTYFNVIDLDSTAKALFTVKGSHNDNIDWLILPMVSVRWRHQYGPSITNRHARKHQVWII